MDFRTFRRNFKTLNQSQQDFLKILSLAYESINQTNLMKLLNQCFIRTDRDTQFTAPYIKSYRQTLLKEKWISSDYQKRIQVEPSIQELVMRLTVIDKRFNNWVKEVQTLLPYREWFRPRNFDVCLRDLRIAMYQGKVLRFIEIIRDLTMYFSAEFEEVDFFNKIFTPFDPAWIKTFPPEMQFLGLNHLIMDSLLNLEPIEEYCSFIEESKFLDDKEHGLNLRSLLHTMYCVKGETHKMEALNKKESNGMNRSIQQGWIANLRGNYKHGLKLSDEVLKNFRKNSNNKNVYFYDLHGLFHLIAIFAEKPKNFLKRIHTWIYHADSSFFLDSFMYLRAVAYYQENHVDEMTEIMEDTPDLDFNRVFWGIVAYWNQWNLTKKNLSLLEAAHQKAKSNGYQWVQMELAGVLSKLEKAPVLRKNFEEEWTTLQTTLGIKSMLPIIKIMEKWERSLQALLQLKGTRKKGGNGTNSTKQSRLIWLVDFDRREIQPKEQTISKSGSWTKGRNVALKRLKEGGVEGISQQDMQVSKTIKINSGWGYYGSGNNYYFDFDAAMKALVDHPLVFRMDSPGVSVEISAKQPELVVEENKGNFEVKFIHDFEEAGTYLLKETPTRYTLLEVTQNHAEINRLLEKGSLKIPEEGTAQLVEVITSLSEMVTVQSAVGEKAVDIPTVEADPTTFVHLLPIGDGFKLEFFVKPFKTDPPYFKPASGRENIIAEIQGQKIQATRNLKAELLKAKNVEEACPSLQKVSSYNREWHFDEVEDCLNVLLEMEPLRESGDLILEHPKGEKLRITGHADFSNLSLGIKKDRDWFGLSGEVKVNENEVVDFRMLLDLVEKSDTRFVQVSEGQYLALTETFRRKIQEINSLVTKTQKGLRFHPLAAPALEDLDDVLGNLKVDAAWKKHLKKLHQARDISPKVPSTFQAELRSYQEVGFKWLSQLAHWGVGACLADDMGLGKTIQALAVLVDRAKDGPALVIAPASVARNWLRETERFAPTLNPLLFGPGDRKEMIANLKPFDLLISTYGLMQSESALLETTLFNTIILDEAQAIKNRATKRSKAAMKLQSNFKIITTGTPIENHLGELWNLFNFLNQGLLGSLERFSETYANPIERYKDNEKRQQLRQLIKPFILRRRKNDVLHELPEKTEITLTVELSPEERHFYEAMRRQALDNIEQIEEGGQKRFTILAELMRLRQACCNPKMILPKSPISSSKLELFGELIQELRQEGHKALVFSQFVKHLRLVENWVKEAGIPYQYLDGQTPLPKREKAINAFQSGEGDIFLISLKAGGTGLNLTAADYVFHLDPWWNPAVEDQASDRAHRIGQKRPVTIYRLVAENTIEEKIVQLHAEKRDLADSLLEGTERAGKLSANDLLDLIRTD